MTEILTSPTSSCSSPISVVSTPAPSPSFPLSPSSPLPLSFFIRSYLPIDRDAARHIFAAAQREYGNSDVYIDYALSHDLSDVSLQYLSLPRSHFFCAVERGSKELLGIVGIRSLEVGDVDYYRFCQSDFASLAARVPQWPKDLARVAELNRMAVTRRARRSGVARALFHACVDFCRQHEYDVLHLSTLATMKQACHFWRSTGSIQYSINRSCWENDPKIGTEEMRVANERWRLEGKGEILTPKDDVRAEEVPDDEALILELRDRGIYYQTHFAYPLLPS